MSPVYRAAALLAAIRHTYPDTIAEIYMQVHEGVETLRVRVDVDVLRDLAAACGADVAVGEWYEPGQRTISATIDDLAVEAYETREVSDAV